MQSTPEREFQCLTSVTEWVPLYGDLHLHLMRLVKQSAVKCSIETYQGNVGCCLAHLALHSQVCAVQPLGQGVCMDNGGLVCLHGTYGCCHKPIAASAASLVCPRQITTGVSHRGSARCKLASPGVSLFASLLAGKIWFGHFAAYGV